MVNAKGVLVRGVPWKGVVSKLVREEVARVVLIDEADSELQGNSEVVRNWAVTF